MGSVQPALAFGVAEIVHVPAAVEVAALVDAPDSFTQAKNLIVLIQRTGKGNAALIPRHGEEGHGRAFRRKAAQHSAGIHGGTKLVAAYHRYDPCFL